MLRISRGNDIVLCKRLMTWNGTSYVDVPCSEVSNLHVKYGTGTIESATDVEYTTSGSIVQFRLESSQISQVGRYNVYITGQWVGNDVAINIAKAFEVVPWNYSTNAQDYIESGTQSLGDDIFIPIPLTNEAIEALKTQLNAAITAANTVKQQYNAALLELPDVARETNATANKNAIIAAIPSISSLATEANATANKAAIIAALPSDYAKEATLGTATDTSASNTIFGKIAGVLATITAWISGSWATFYSAWGTVLSNYARRSDLPTDYAKQGNDSTATNSAILEAIQANAAYYDSETESIVLLKGSYSNETITIS